VFIGEQLKDEAVRESANSEYVIKRVLRLLDHSKKGYLSRQDFKKLVSHDGSSTKTDLKATLGTTKAKQKTKQLDIEGDILNSFDWKKSSID
jgi:hypothetical protein